MCKMSYCYKTGLKAHTMTKHTIAYKPKNPVDKLSKERANIEVVHIMDHADDADIYNADVQASQQTNENKIKYILSEILNNLLVEVVEKDDNVDKMPILPDANWTRRTTGDLGALLDNISVEALPEAIECERCDKRFTSKDEIKEQTVSKHSVERDYDLLYRKHEKLLDKHVILTRANKYRLEITEDNSRIRKVLIKSDEAVHETSEANQVLEETLKIKDMDINGGSYQTLERRV